MKRLNIYTIIISSFVYLFISSLLVNASVVLNEVAIQPNQVVELYNTASTSADISGWYIDDSGGTTYYSIPQQTVLAPLSCAIFTADFNFNKASADVVRLFDNSYPPTTASAKLIESYSYSKAPDTGYSFIKTSDGGALWQTNISSLGLFNESLVSCIPSPTTTPFPTEPPLQLQQSFQHPPHSLHHPLHPTPYNLHPLQTIPTFLSPKYFPTPPQTIMNGLSYTMIMIFRQHLSIGILMMEKMQDLPQNLFHSRLNPTHMLL